MSQMPHTTNSPSAYQTIFDNALAAYQKKTGKDLASHPLLRRFESCNSPDSVFAVLREHIPGFGQSENEDNWVTKWLDPTVRVLLTFSATVSGVVSLAFPPAGVIFTGIGVFLSAVKAVGASKAILRELLDSIGCFFERLNVYVESQPAAELTGIIVDIMAEVLSILALATKEIKESKGKKLLGNLLGRDDIANAMGRLDRLTQGEGLMVGAQILKSMQVASGRLDGVSHGVEKLHQDIADNFDYLNRNQFRRDIRRWLSPPDPSVNYHIGCKAQYKDTTTWFTQGPAFKDWKTSGSLIWISGKLGSGKSVLTSAIIQDMEDITNSGSAHMAYFFFDFKNEQKKDARALLVSLLVQLSDQSDSFCDILHEYYRTHQLGSLRPKESVLMKCLEEMLKIPVQVPIFLIVDGLDECPNLTGIPSARGEVLALVKQLVELKSHNLRLCITSRPEIDIRTSLGPTCTRISLHDERGQKADIDNYINSVVYSDAFNPPGWKDEHRQSVVKSLSPRADGMFRWVVCVLEILRHCHPRDLPRSLDNLPESLDETYERILNDIPELQRKRAHLILQCLTVATRPLRVEELAQVLTAEIPTTGGLPKVEVDQHWEDQEEAVLYACSSLIALVEVDNSRLVQFSHFSVKEYLTLGRLANSIGEFHILEEPAHEFMAHACLGALLQLEDTDEQSMKSFPLARYAAQHWVDHAEYGDVLSRIQDVVDCLLDGNKPHFATWIWLRKISPYPIPPSSSEHCSKRLKAVPLYYVAELGICCLVKYLVSKRPEDLSAKGGQYGTPLHAAVNKRHVQVLELLAPKGVDVRDCNGHTPLHAASRLGYADIGRELLGYGADVNAHDDGGRTPLHLAAADGRLEVIGMLLDHDADTSMRDSEGHTPLQTVLDGDSLAAARLLLQHQSSGNARDGAYSHPAAFNRDPKITMLLVQHGANVHMRDNNGQTLLHHAVWDGSRDLMQLLLEHDADVNAKDNAHTTPLHLASYRRDLTAVQLLLDHGANVHVLDKEGRNPLRIASKRRHQEIMRLLSERT